MKFDFPEALMACGIGALISTAPLYIVGNTNFGQFLTTWALATSISAVTLYAIEERMTRRLL
jgi:hypothetical protein